MNRFSFLFDAFGPPFFHAGNGPAQSKNVVSPFCLTHFRSFRRPVATERNTRPPVGQAS